MNNTIDIMNRGINCLIEELGVVEAEQFISVIIREKFDYTKWQKEYFNEISSDDFNNAAISYSKNYPFNK